MSNREHRSQNTILASGLAISLWLIAGVSAVFSQAPADLNTLLQQAAAHRRVFAYHREAVSLERALELSQPGSTGRWRIAQKLLECYRSSLCRFEDAQALAEKMADELSETDHRIESRFTLAESYLNHGLYEQASDVYARIINEIAAPDPPYDRHDRRVWIAWHHQQLCDAPKGADPIFNADIKTRTALQRFLQHLRAGRIDDARQWLRADSGWRSAVQIRAETSTRWTSARQWLRWQMQNVPVDVRLRLAGSYEEQLQTIAGADNWRQLLTYRLSHPIPELEHLLDQTCGDRLLDHARPMLASLLYELSEPAEPANTADATLRAREVFARIFSHQSVNIESLSEEPVTIAGTTKSLQEWARQWQREAKGRSAGIDSSGLLDWSALNAYRLTLENAPAALRGWQYRWYARRNFGDKIDGRVASIADKFVITRPAGPAESVIVNLGHLIQAIDVQTQEACWTFRAPEENSMSLPYQLPDDDKLMIECGRTRSAIVTDDDVFAHLLWGHHDTDRAVGAVVKLDRETGSLAWSSTYDPQLRGIEIAGDPAMYKGVLVALAWQPLEPLPLFYAVGISAETGEVLWLTHLFSGRSTTVFNNQLFLDRPRACGPPVIVDGVAYMETGAGVVVGVNVIDGTIKWAVEYPRIESISKAYWASRHARSRPAGTIAVTDSLVTFAPIDSRLLLGLDRETGELQYQQRRLDLRAILTASTEQIVLLENTTIHAIDPSTTETRWETPLPVSGIVGLPTVSDNGLLCPSWEGLFLVDLQDGSILQHYEWDRSRACGYVLDAGESLVGASRLGLELITSQPIDAAIEDRVLAPEEPTAITIDNATKNLIRSQQSGILKWTLPAVDRGNAVLSRQNPEYVICQSEILQLRSMGPMPTLIWQRPSPIPWSGLTAFDDQHVIAYNMARMWSYDIATGALRWTATLDPHVGFGDDWGVELAGETFFWWGPQRVYACDSTTGQQRWDYACPRGAIRSLCLEDDVIGLFVEMPGSYEQSPEHKAIILDRADGTVLDELAVPRPEPELAGPVMVRGKPYRPVRLPSILPGRTGPEADAGYANAVLLDGVLPVEVDWQNRTVRTGQPAIALTNKQVVDARFEVYDTCVCLRGMNEDPPRHKDRLYRLWQRSDLTKRRVPPNQRWAVADGQLYTFANHRLHRHDLREGKAAWHSDAMPKAARKIIPVGQKIFVVMEDDSFYEKGVRDVSQVKLYDRETGQELQACDLPKRWMHHIHPHEDGLVIWDINFLYRLGLPENSSVAVADEKMLDRAQPDALAAIRLARDLESPRVVTVNKIDDSPTIDGDLDEWSGLQAIDLTAASHFKPDFAQTSVAKHRAVRSDEDLAARIYCASADGTVYIAVEVQDDTHVANSSPGLWRNDSVSLMAAHPHLDLTDPLIATFACLPGVTRIEVGNPVQVMVAPDPPGVVPDVIQQARTIDASIAAAMLSLPAGDSEIQAASRRHDALGITCYEFAVPQSWLDSADGARFDLVIHDNDGQGRKGALHLASLHWSIEETARTGASYRKGAHGHPSAP